MDLEDLLAFDVRARDDGLAVGLARTQQRGIGNVGTVGRGDNDNALVRFEAVHFDEQLVERLFALVIAVAKAGTAMATDRVDFVDEDNAARCACSNMSRTRLAPTPTNISTKSEPEMVKKGTPASPAIARAAASCRSPASRRAVRPSGS